MGAADWVDQAELSRLLGIGTRQVRNLESSGLPHRMATEAEARARGLRYGVAKLYPIPDAINWHAQFKYDRDQGLSPLKQVELRAMRAKAEREEYELGIRRGDYVARADVARMVREPLSRVNALLQSAPATYAPRMVGIKSIPEALEMLRRAIDEIRTELRELSGVELGPSTFELEPDGEEEEGIAEPDETGEEEGGPPEPPPQRGPRQAPAPGGGGVEVLF